MKNFSKKMLLMVAVAVGLSAVAPVYAMDEVAGEVNQKTGFFAGWDRKSLQDRLDSNMKSLNKQWNSFMKCLKGEGCTGGQKTAIIGTLTSILAIVGALTVAGASYRGAKVKGGGLSRTEMFKKSKAGQAASDAYGKIPAVKAGRQAAANRQYLEEKIASIQQDIARAQSEAREADVIDLLQNLKDAQDELYGSKK